MENMEKFFNTLGPPGRVLDVGSSDPEGSYRRIFKGWNYVGLDVVPGKNVNFIPRDPYKWIGLDNESFDIVISGQALEHIEHPGKSFAEIFRVLKRGGKCCIIAPSAGPPHSNRRISWFRNMDTKQMRDLAEDSGLTVENIHVDLRPPWHDCVLIAKKK